MGKMQPHKLVLSRETIRDLTPQDMQHVEGGNGNGLSGGHGTICLLTLTGDPCQSC